MNSSNNYTPIEDILYKNSAVKNKSNSKTKSFCIGKIGGLMEKEKDLEFKKRLFDCNYKINDAFINIMSSNVTIDSENDSENKTKKPCPDKKNNNLQLLKKKKFILDNRDDIMDLGITKVKSKTNQKQKKSTKKTITNKLTIKPDEDISIRKKINFEIDNEKEKEKERKSTKFNLIEINLNENNINLNISQINENKVNKGNNTTTNTNRKLSSNKIHIINKQENLVNEKANLNFNKHENFNAVKFQRINDLKNNINKNVFSKTFNYFNCNRKDTKAKANSNEINNFEMSNFDKFNYQEKVLISNKNQCTRDHNYSYSKDYKDYKSHKNSYLNYSKNVEKKDKNNNNNNSEHNYSEDLNQSKEYDYRYQNESNNTTKNKYNSNKENLFSFSKRKSYIEFDDNDSDKEYERELVKNKKQIIKKRNTIRQIIAKPEDFDGILYKNKKSENEIKNQNNFKSKYSNSTLANFRKTKEFKNYLSTFKSNSKKSLNSVSQKSTPKEKKIIGFNKNTNNSNKKNEKNTNDGNGMLIRDVCVTVNSSDLVNSEFDKKTQLLMEENKNKNRNQIGSVGSDKFSYQLFKNNDNSVRDINSRKSRIRENNNNNNNNNITNDKYNNRDINSRKSQRNDINNNNNNSNNKNINTNYSNDNNNFKVNKLEEIKENMKMNKIFSIGEASANQKRLDSLRERLITPSTNGSKCTLNPGNFIRSITKIQNKTNKITKLFNKKVKNYKNQNNIEEKKEDPIDLFLKIPKIDKKLRNKVTMISSSVEEHRKNFTHLSDNKRNLLEIGDFIESMNDKIVLNLKDNLFNMYKKSAERNGLIEITEIMKEKLLNVFKRENVLRDIIIKSKQMENDMLITRGKIERKYLQKKNEKNLKKK